MHLQKAKNVQQNQSACLLIIIFIQNMILWSGSGDHDETLIFQDFVRFGLTFVVVFCTLAHNWLCLWSTTSFLVADVYIPSCVIWINFRLFTHQAVFYLVLLSLLLLSNLVCCLCPYISGVLHSYNVLVEKNVQLCTLCNSERKSKTFSEGIPFTCLFSSSMQREPCLKVEPGKIFESLSAK